MRTAEKLFAQKGVSGVSLREISAAAGQKNHSAAGYHFGTIDGLVDAILWRHSEPIQRSYELAMDAADRVGGLSAEDVLKTLVRPIVAKLADADGGPEYLAICAQLAIGDQPPLEARAVGNTPTITRMWSPLLSRVAVGGDRLPLRIAATASTIYLSTLQYGRLKRAGAVDLDADAFVDDLAGILLALITRP